MAARPSLLRRLGLGGLASAGVIFAVAAPAAVQVSIGFEPGPGGGSGFDLTNLPAPARNDAATVGRVRVIAGTIDSNSGGIGTLCDGRLPTEDDQPDANFFFAAGSEGGRLLFDLERVLEVKQVNSYSRHPDTRGPQVYKLFASDGLAAGFVQQPQKETDLIASGWKQIAMVDTRPRSGSGGGQHGVSISDTDGILGKYRYLLFDISRTEATDAFGNTFYSEIDVIEEGATNVVAEVAVAPFTFKSADGYCEFSVDTARSPELTEWVAGRLSPVLAEWFPKIVAMLPSEGFSAPKRIAIVIRPGDGVAAASGTRITANATWLARELNGEAIGALLHEVVHVVQQYGGGRRGSSGAQRPPGWLVEGIPDYIRFFKYEPQNHGADLIWLEGRRNQVLNYDGMYRISANFLNYVVEHYGKTNEIIAQVNAACRQGNYTDERWRELTGKTLGELNEEWKSSVKQQMEARAAAGLNVLTEGERAAGWRLLFNGEDFAGWHNFKRDGVRPGWRVKDGLLVCADPHDAGDLVTTSKFRAFELELEYNISEGGNSGIMFHVTDEGGAVWATGPEFQLEDNAKAKDPQRCGWLYALYQPADDPKTGRPLDATKPAGEWNKVRLVISPEKCEHWINGVKYFDYVIGSGDFNARVAKSKFSRMPLFAKSGEGYLALQGDHGQISFRNLKIRSLPVRSANR